MEMEMEMEESNSNSNSMGGGVGVGLGLGLGLGKAMIMMVCGSLVYYHCAYRESSLLSLVSDVFIVLLCSLAILGLLFRQMNIQVPVDPLEWQISQDSANAIFACLANTVGATESVLRVAATGHDKRLFLKVVGSLYMLSALGRWVSGVTVAYAGMDYACFVSMLLLRIHPSSPLPWPPFAFSSQERETTDDNTTIKRETTDDNTTIKRETTDDNTTIKLDARRC